MFGRRDRLQWPPKSYPALGLRMTSATIVRDSSAHDRIVPDLRVDAESRPAETAWNCTGGEDEVLPADVHQATVDQPQDNVPAPIAPLDPADPGGGEEDLAAGIGKVLDDLATRLAAANHQHSPCLEDLGGTVVRCIYLADERGDPLRHRRLPWSVEAPAGNNHVPSRQRPAWPPTADSRSCTWEPRQWRRIDWCSAVTKPRRRNVCGQTALTTNTTLSRSSAVVQVPRFPKLHHRAEHAVPRSNRPVRAPGPKAG